MNLDFFDIGFWDIVDILIVGYLLYLLYKLLKGSIAFNIFIGMAILYGAWLIVKMLQMNLLSVILGQFFNIGLIILIIIFQPEVRRFLLMVGDSTFGQRGNLFKRWIAPKEDTAILSKSGFDIIDAIEELSLNRIGVLIILAKPLQLDYFSKSGILLQAHLSKELLVGLFQKDNPLHDGAVIVHGDKVERASVILPVSDKNDLPSNMGLRHRAALGASEQFGTKAIVVSEETGLISWVESDEIYNIDTDQLTEKLLSWI